MVPGAIVVFLRSIGINEKDNVAVSEYIRLTTHITCFKIKINKLSFFIVV